MESRFTHSGVKSSVQPKRHEYLEKCFHISEKAEERKREEFKTIVDLVRYEHDKKYEEMMALISTLSKSKKRKRESSDSD